MGVAAHSARTLTFMTPPPRPTSGQGSRRTHILIAPGHDEQTRVAPQPGFITSIANMAQPDRTRPLPAAVVRDRPDDSAALSASKGDRGDVYKFVLDIFQFDQ
jgi:hypothetical protein